MASHCLLTGWTDNLRHEPIHVLFRRGVAQDADRPADLGGKGQGLRFVAYRVALTEAAHVGVVSGGHFYAPVDEQQFPRRHTAGPR